MKKLLLLAPAALLACAGHAPPLPAPPAEAAAPSPAAAAPSPAAARAAARVRARTLLARAQALRAEGDVPGARDRLEDAIEADPASPGVRLELAEVIVAEGLELDRGATLLAGLDETPDGRVSLVRARLLEARSDDAAAELAYGAALAARDDPDVRLRRALALERLGRTDAEIVELERLRADRPGDAYVRAHLASAYEGSGRRRDAEVELRWLAELEPDRPAGWLRLARFYERAGRAHEAREAAQRARAASAPRHERALRPLLPSRS